MGKKAKNGIYTTGKKSFEVTISGDKVMIHAIDTIDANPNFYLKAGDERVVSIGFLESLLNDELFNYYKE